MILPPKKRKGGNSPPKYPGKLGRRRRPTAEQDLQAGWKALTGKGASPAEDALAFMADIMVNRKYYDEGLALIADHLKIKNTNRPDFWVQLAYCLLERHVPYFMPPTRRGPPPKLQAFLPALSGLMAEIRKGNLEWTVDRAYHEAAKFLACDYETVRREFVRWKRKQGRNSAK